MGGLCLFIMSDWYGLNEITQVQTTHSNRVWKTGLISKTSCFAKETEDTIRITFSYIMLPLPANMDRSEK